MWNAIKIMIVFLDKNVARKQTNVNIRPVTEVEIVLEIKNVVVENVSPFASMYFSKTMLLNSDMLKKLFMISNFWARDRTFYGLKIKLTRDVSYTHQLN